MGMYTQTRGPTIAIYPRLGGYEQTNGYDYTVNSTDIVEVRISGFAQRPFSNTGDLAGRVYADGIHIGTPVTLMGVYFSYDLSGPWAAVTPDTADPLCVWPGLGIPAGSPFNLPLELDTPGPALWFKIIASF